MYAFQEQMCAWLRYVPGLLYTCRQILVNGIKTSYANVEFVDLLDQTQRHILEHNYHLLLRSATNASADDDNTQRVVLERLWLLAVFTHDEPSSTPAS